MWCWLRIRWAGPLTVDNLFEAEVRWRIRQAYFARFDAWFQEHVIGSRDKPKGSYAQFTDEGTGWLGMVDPACPPDKAYLVPRGFAERQYRQHLVNIETDEAVLRILGENDP